MQFRKTFWKKLRTCTKFLRVHTISVQTAKLQHAAEAGVPVVVCSQCLYERSDFSVYEVGQKALGSGVIQGFDMTSEAAVTKLMWALGNCETRDEVRAMFNRNLAGEVDIVR